MPSIRRLLFLAWGLSITAGALWIRVCRPQDSSPVLAALVASEPFHIAAHAFLYGTLAWLCARRVPLPWVVPIVLALGGLQELAQVLGSRPMGSRELYDLGVDAVAAACVVEVVRRRNSQGRRRTVLPGVLSTHPRRPPCLSVLRPPSPSSRP